MYPKWMIYVLFYFELWGFSTHFEKSSYQRKKYRIICVFHCFSASLSTFEVIKFLQRPNDDLLGTFADALKLFGFLFVYWVTIFELNTNQHIQRKFWHIVQKIDDQFCSHQHIRFDKYIIKMIAFFILFSIMHINYYVILFRSSGIKLLEFLIVFTLLQTFLKNYLFYYLFHLEFVKYQLKTINREARLMIGVYKNSITKVEKKFATFHHRRFKWIRDYYDTVFDMCDGINTIFGWSNAAAIIISFCVILNDTFWFYWKILNKYEIDRVGKCLK